MRGFNEALGLELDRQRLRSHRRVIPRRAGLWLIGRLEAALRVATIIKNPHGPSERVDLDLKLINLILVVRLQCRHLPLMADPLLFKVLLQLRLRSRLLRGRR